MSGRARKRPTFEWHHAPQGAPATVRLRHADISINNASGRPSAQSSSIIAPASPSKAPPTERLYTEDYLLHQMGMTAEVDDGMGWGGGLGEHLDEGEPEDEEELAIDPNYQRHLDELGGEKKKRTQVCPSIPSSLWPHSQFSFAEQSTPHMAWRSRGLPIGAPSPRRSRG